MWNIFHIFVFLYSKIMNKLTEQEKENLEQFIRGSILGDGYIEPIKNKTDKSRMKFCHSTKQECYIFLKYKYLASLNLVKSDISKYTSKNSRYKSGESTTLSFNTLSDNIFAEFRKKYYKNGKKSIDRNDISKIDDFALTVWYLDDGNLWKSSKGNWYRIMLSTNSFEKEEVLFLMELLRKKWGFSTSYYKSRNTIIINSISVNDFLKTVNINIPNCLKYKVHLKSDELLENPEEDNQQPS